MWGNLLIAFFLFALLYSLYNIIGSSILIEDYPFSTMTDDKVIDFSGMFYLNPFSSSHVDISNLLLMSGFSLLIWGTSAPRKIKITASLYPLIAVIYWGMLWQDLQEADILLLRFSLIWVLIVVIFFFSICMLVSQWKKESTNIDTIDI